MINTAKFPWELSHPDNFFELSSLSDDHRHVCDSIDAKYSLWRGISTPFFNRLRPQRLTFFLVIMLILGKR